MQWGRLRGKRGLPSDQANTYNTGRSLERPFKPAQKTSGDGKQIEPITGSHMAVNKVVPSFTEAVEDIADGAFVMIGGFGGQGGMPQNLIRALLDHGIGGLTIISNTAGLASAIGFGTVPSESPIDLGILIENDRVKKIIASYPVSPSPSSPTSFEHAYREGKVDLEVVPQGTLAERIRAGGAGIPAFYTPTGVGTLMAEGKETRRFGDRDYLLEHSLTADFALIRAHRADALGNVAYRGTSQNFNGVMAMAARTTIAEVDEVIEPGGLDWSAAIDTPGIYVKRVVQIRG